MWDYDLEAAAGFLLSPVPTAAPSLLGVASTPPLQSTALQAPALLCQKLCRTPCNKYLKFVRFGSMPFQCQSENLDVSDPPTKTLCPLEIYFSQFNTRTALPSPVSHSVTVASSFHASSHHLFSHTSLKCSLRKAARGFTGSLHQSKILMLCMDIWIVDDSDADNGDNQRQWQWCRVCVGARVG